MLSVVTTPHTYTHRQGHEETFGGDGCIYYLNCGDSIMGVCIDPNSSKCIH